MCKQVRFRIVDSSIGDTTEILGGIAIYEEDEKREKYLINVICGCCGGMLEPEDVEIIEEYPSWIDLVDTIIGT